MSERDTCPYCGAPVSSEFIGSPDETIMVTCSRCGGRFEYIAGFGAFAPDKQKPSIKADGIKPEIETLQAESARPAAIIKEKGESKCCKCSIYCCIIYSIIILIGFIMAVFI